MKVNQTWTSINFTTVCRHVWTVPKSMLQCSFGSQETRSQWWNQLTDNLKTLRECRECLMVYHSDILPMDSFWSLETAKTKKLSKWSPCFVINIQYWCLSYTGCAVLQYNYWTYTYCIWLLIFMVLIIFPAHFFD